MKADQCSRNVAIMRQLQQRNRLLSEGDFYGALKTRPQRTNQEEREEFNLPKPDAIDENGNRSWSF